MRTRSRDLARPVDDVSALGPSRGRVPPCRRAAYDPSPDPSPVEPSEQPDSAIGTSGTPL